MSGWRDLSRAIGPRRATVWWLQDRADPFLVRWDAFCEWWYAWGPVMAAAIMVVGGVLWVGAALLLVLALIRRL